MLVADLELGRGSVPTLGNMALGASRVPTLHQESSSEEQIRDRIAALLAMRRLRRRRVQLPIFCSGLLLTAAGLIRLGLGGALPFYTLWAYAPLASGLCILTLSILDHDRAFVTILICAIIGVLCFVAAEDVRRAARHGVWLAVRHCKGDAYACQRGAVVGVTLAASCCGVACALALFTAHMCSRLSVKAVLMHVWRLLAFLYFSYSLAYVNSLINVLVNTDGARARGEWLVFHCAMSGVLFSLASLLCAWPALRPRIYRFLATRGDGVTAAAALGEVLVGVAANDVLKLAADSFHAVRMDQLTFEHILAPAPPASPAASASASLTQLRRVASATRVPRAFTASAEATAAGERSRRGAEAHGRVAAAPTHASPAHSAPAHGIPSPAHGMPSPALCDDAVVARVALAGSLGEGAADDETPMRAADARGSLAATAAISRPARLGCVDAFVSHSWSDDAHAKWEALQAWRVTFKAAHGREPLIWLDCCCIDQTDIAAQLPSLPIYLAGCSTLLVLHGPSYASRLWCICELFCFYQVHLPEPPEARIHFISLRTARAAGAPLSLAPPPSAPPPSAPPPSAPPPSAPPPSRSTAGSSTSADGRSRGVSIASDENEFAEALAAAAAFDVRNATTTVVADRARLLAMIEGSGEGFDAFNAWTRALVMRKLVNEHKERTPELRPSASNGLALGHPRLATLIKQRLSQTRRAQAATLPAP